eukprot:193608-Pelagomonas_calceolata.AAC.1
MANILYLTEYWEIHFYMYFAMISFKGSRSLEITNFGTVGGTEWRFGGVPGKIHASAATQSLLLHEKWVPTGQVEVKGKERILQA